MLHAAALASLGGLFLLARTSAGRAAAAGGVVALLVGLGFTDLGSSWWALAWALPLVGLAVAAARLRDLPRHALAGGLGVLALAVAARFLAPGTVLNQHAELRGSARALVPALELRPHGIYALFRVVDARLHPIGDGTIFAVDRLLGAAAVALLALALLPAPEEERGPRWSVAGVLGAAVLLAVEPATVRMAASDAVVAPVLFGFALGAFLYRRAGRLGPGGLLALFGVAGFVGLLRPEQALAAPILYPALVGPAPRPAAEGEGSGRAGLRRFLEALAGPNGAWLLVAVAAGTLAVAARSNFGTAVAAAGFAPDRGGAVRDLLHGLADTLLAGLPGASRSLARSPGLAPPLLPPAFGTGVLLAVGWAVARRRRRTLAAWGGLLLLFAGRLLTPFAATPFAEDFADVRYDAITLPVALFLVAEALGDLGERAAGLARRRLRLPGARAAVVGALVPAALVGGAVALGGPWRSSRALLLGYQREYAFLRKHLGAVPRDCPLVAVDLRNDADLWMDDVLFLPHGGLSYAFPEVRWHPLTQLQAADSVLGARCAYYYQGGACALLPATRARSPRRDDPAWRAPLDRAERECRLLRGAAAETVAEEDGPGVALRGNLAPRFAAEAGAHAGPYPDDRLPLGLYRLDLQRLGRDLPRPQPDGGAGLAR